MIDPGHFDSSTFNFVHGGQMVTAKVIATLQMKGTNRAILMDAEERHWVVGLDDNLQIGKVMIGPLTGTQALHAAEGIVAGVADHGSVTRIVNQLALGVIILANQLEANAA